MGLTPLDLPPGIYGEDSPHAAQGRWIDANNVRFFRRFAEKIGGFVALSESNVDLRDPARGAHVWRTLNGLPYLAFGTRRKLWLYDGNDTLHNITPIRSSGQLSNPFTTANGSPIVTVAHAGHGASNGGTAHPMAMPYSSPMPLLSAGSLSTANMRSRSSTQTATPLRIPSRHPLARRAAAPSITNMKFQLA
jgi:hypothetical protein